MKTDRIKVSVEYTYHGLSRWVGMEASLDETDNGKEKECLKQLETTAREFISESVKEQKEVPVVQQEKIPALSGEAKIIAEMLTVTDMKVLEGYRLVVKGKPAMEAAYEQMKEKLSK